MRFWLAVETIALYYFPFYIAFPTPTVNSFQETLVATVFCNATLTAGIILCSSALTAPPLDFRAYYYLIKMCVH